MVTQLEEEILEINKHLKYFKEINLEELYPYKRACVFRKLLDTFELFIEFLTSIPEFTEEEIGFMKEQIDSRERLIRDNLEEVRKVPEAGKKSFFRAFRGYDEYIKWLEEELQPIIEKNDLIRKILEKMKNEK